MQDQGDWLLPSADIGPLNDEYELFDCVLQFLNVCFLISDLNH